MSALESTASLVVRARLGEAGAFEELVRRHLRAAYAVALAVLGSPADAEDVAQDAFLAAFERLDECEPERFAGWVLKIVRNRALNAKEKWRGRLAEDPGPERGAPGQAEQAGLRKNLLAALEHLSPVQREVVLLHDLEGWTHPEIAESLEMSEVMSRQHLFQARKLLRERLGDGAAGGGSP